MPLHKERAKNSKQIYIYFESIIKTEKLEDWIAKTKQFGPHKGIVELKKSQIQENEAI